MAKKAAKKVAKKVTKKVTKKKAPALPEIGSIAPLFTLKDQNGNDVSLESFRGSNVVVYFYPRAMTPGCTVQACGLRDSAKELKKLKIVVLGISGDPQKSLKKFEERDHLNFPLLSDADHKVALAYGSWGEKKFMGRTFDGIFRQSFFIDPEGKIAHIMSKVDTKTHHDDVINFFKNRK